jgi:3-carboxy-cis,cis-muconate cycloisomerase
MPRSLLQHLAGDAEFEALFSDDAEIAAMLRFEGALAGAEADAGLIDAGAAEVVAETLSHFEPDLEDLAAGLISDGVVVPALVRQLRTAVGTHGACVHLGVTSQDAIDTGLLLRLATAIELIDQRLAAIETAFANMAGGSGTRTMMAHTRMQRALPMPVRTKIAAWSAPLNRARLDLSRVRRGVLVIQLGGPVGTRAELGDKADEVARRLAERLGLGVAPPWHTERYPIAEFASILSLITGSLGKFGVDVLLLSQNEIATIVIAGGGGSSAMPHKSNPVNAELLVSLARFNASLLGAVHQTLVHENERSGSAWTLEWLTLPQMVVATGASLRIALALAGQIDFQSERPV